MKNLIKLFNRPDTAAPYLGVLLLVPALLWSSVQTVSATETDASQEDAVIESPAAATNNFEYILEGRDDPFMPFIQPEASTQLDPNEIVEKNVVLSGMQLFEPGQLTLVAVLHAGDRKVAMVEDDTGKGYTIHEGMLIGSKGIVSEITDNNDVIITETAQTRSGKEIVTTVVMRLNKEGD